MIRAALWTPERDAMLAELWGSGVACSEIGRRLGMSKNAIIGRAHRTCARTQKSVVQAAADTETTRHREYAFDLVGPQQCRFPIGDPPDPDFHFCCAEVEREDRAYCELHHRIAYRPMLPSSIYNITTGRN